MTSVYYGLAGVAGGIVVGVVVPGVVAGVAGLPGAVVCGTVDPGCVVGCVGMPGCGSLGLVAGSGVTGGVVAGVVVCALRALLLGALGFRRCSGVLMFRSSLFVRVRSVDVRLLSALLLLMVSVCAEAIPKASRAHAV